VCLTRLAGSLLRARLRRPCAVTLLQPSDLQQHPAGKCVRWSSIAALAGSRWPATGTCRHAGLACLPGRSAAGRAGGHRALLSVGGRQRGRAPQLPRPARSRAPRHPECRSCAEGQREPALRDRRDQRCRVGAPAGKPEFPSRSSCRETAYGVARRSDRSWRPGSGSGQSTLVSRCCRHIRLESSAALRIPASSRRHARPSPTPLGDDDQTWAAANEALLVGHGFAARQQHAATEAAAAGHQVDISFAAGQLTAATRLV
jgi:hypothetical protein